VCPKWVPAVPRVNRVKHRPLRGGLAVVTSPGQPSPGEARGKFCLSSFDRPLFSGSRPYWNRPWRPPPLSTNAEPSQVAPQAPADRLTNGLSRSHIRAPAKGSALTIAFGQSPSPPRLSVKPSEPVAVQSFPDPIGALGVSVRSFPRRRILSRERVWPGRFPPLRAT